MTTVDTTTAADDQQETTTALGREWWRSSVIYQVYPRSFADSDGDGLGDLDGIARRLPELRELGVDAVWLSPFFRSPQKDAGYDVTDYRDVDPIFGTLADAERLIAEAHDLGLRVIADMVPNHTSDQHVWFRQALAAAPGSPERARYIFRDGRGEDGSLPPNNWESVFGGSMWTRVDDGQWFLHIFDSSQPDLDWTNDEVRAEFRDVLRFWLDRGIDGFRVDVAHGMIKAPGLPDYTPPAESGSMGGGMVDATDLEPAAVDDEPDHPYWGRPEVHEIWREWRTVVDEYPGERVLCGEAWVDPLSRMAKWVRPDEMHQTFNFPYLETPWEGPALTRVIQASLDAFGAVGAPSTWVLSNHDVVRHASRLALTAANPQGSGIGPDSPGRPIPELGLRRARAATALMLALPGGAYIYQGEELGLPEAIDLPDDARQDPTWFRTGGERYGRDGCRVPIPWEADAPAYGFNETGASWLPQPADWAPFARDSQRGVAGSTLELYRAALALRREHDLGLGTVEWIPGSGAGVVAFRNGSVTVYANTGEVPVELPLGEMLLASTDVSAGTLPADATVWLLTE
jgi:alpha-glucosidase